MNEPQHAVLEQNENDDSGFINIVRSSVIGTVHLTQPRILHIVRIDDWFDHKWLGFSGKILGQLGVRRHSLTVPPFHPHRVLSERVFEMVDRSSGSLQDSAKPLHATRKSEENTRLYLSDIYSSAVVVWYSGKSAVTHRAALMIYVITSQEPTAWYAGYEKRDAWTVVHRSGISEQELADIQTLGADIG